MMIVVPAFKALAAPAAPLEEPGKKKKKKKKKNSEKKNSEKKKNRGKGDGDGDDEEDAVAFARPRDGEYITSIGDIRYSDYLQHQDPERRKQYKQRHEKEEV